MPSDGDACLGVSEDHLDVDATAEDAAGAEAINGLVDSHFQASEDVAVCVRFCQRPLFLAEVMNRWHV